MIRWAEQGDCDRIIEVLHAAKAGWRGYQYDRTLAGTCLVEERQGVIVGILLGQLGRPESYIRELAVHPECEDLGVARDLIAAFMWEAARWGSQAIEAFQYEGNGSLIGMAVRRRVHIDKGVRVRIPLSLKSINACPPSMYSPKAVQRTERQADTEEAREVSPAVPHGTLETWRDLALMPS